MLRPNSKDGEMSEWLKEHAWKAILATLTKQHRNTSLRNQFNDLPSHDARRCDSVTSVFVAAFEPTLHSSYTILVFT